MYILYLTIQAWFLHIVYTSLSTLTAFGTLSRISNLISFGGNKGCYYQLVALYSVAIIYTA